MLYIQHGKVKLTVDKTYESTEPRTWIVTGEHIIDIPPITATIWNSWRTRLCTTMAAVIT